MQQRAGADSAHIPLYIHFLTMTPEGEPISREEIEEEIDRLIDLLNTLDGDPDLEPCLAGTCGDDREGDLDARCVPGLSEGDDNPDDEDGGEREPSLGAPENHINSYCGWSHYRGRDGDQTHWGAWDTRAAIDECECENEHGGDILDEPHDEECDAEPFLGWTEDESKSESVITSDEFPRHEGYLNFDGSGYRAGSEALRGLRTRNPNLPISLPRISPTTW